MYVSDMPSATREVYDHRRSMHHMMGISQARELVCPAGYLFRSWMNDNLRSSDRSTGELQPDSVLAIHLCEQ